MSGPHTWAGSPLTPSQRAVMIALRAGGAIDRDTAIGPFHRAWNHAGMIGCNPNVLGATRNKGFTLSRTARPAGGSQQTLYWLTPEGLAELERFEADAANPSKGKA